MSNVNAFLFDKKYLEHKLVYAHLWYAMTN